MSVARSLELFEKVPGSVHPELAMRTHLITAVSTCSGVLEGGGASAQVNPLKPCTGVARVLPVHRATPVQAKRVSNRGVKGLKTSILEA